MIIANPLNPCTLLAAARRRYARAARRPTVYYTAEALRFGGYACPDRLEVRDLVAKHGTYPTVFVIPVDQPPVDPA
jgi:hypothetical protein